MKISVITVCFNNLKGLEKTFESVTNLRKSFEEYLEIEWVVIDGGSTDGTQGFLQLNDPLIDYWVSEKDNGIYNAMNKGISKASGDYYIFMNSGDTFADELLRYPLYEDLNEGKDLIVGNYFSIDENFQKTLIEQSDTLNLEFFVGHNLCHQSIFFSSKLFENEQYDESFKMAADLNFIVRSLFLRNCSYMHIPVPVCVYESFGRSIAQYYSCTRGEIRRAVSNIIPGGEYYYDAIIMRKEMEDEVIFEKLEYISRTNKLKSIVRVILSFVVKIDAFVKNCKRRYLHK